ncbi:MAG: hypothetical protein NTX93_10720 [Bacteroidia bacterium]|nr:hypothetical protein [Bacteroidia bacterium]
MRYPVILLYTTFLLFAQVTFAQYYDTGQDPASLKWMQIKTGRFTVIYPETYGSGGMAFAQSLEEAYSKLISLFPERKFKIPVVIHNFSTQSNGYVAWAPRRMEIYPTPIQNTIPLDPERQLAIHELTHVFQMESLNEDFSKTMSLILGEQFTGIVASLLPLWFLEGNAVFAESALTESGRGRSPSFQKQLKAIAVEQGSMYKYDKMVNGSYRDYIPDHYQSGYQMVTWALAKYDLQIWNKVLNCTAKQPFTINPVNISLSRSAGITKKSLFKETFDTLKTIWTKDVSENNALFYETLNPAREGKFINYYSPVFAGTDSIIAIKTSLAAPPSFVLINPSKKSEKKIHTPGQMYPWFISYANGKLVWVETQPDPRWENRDYSIIKLMDLSNNKIKRLSRKSRYLSASLSPDGRKIAAIENTINNINNIVLIDAETGSILQSVPAPGNAYLQRPQWAEGGGKITVIFLTEAGEGIMEYTLASQEWETLIEAGREDLQSSFLRNDSLFFISSLSGTDNIYIRTPDRKITSLTRSRFGVSDLSLFGGKIIFSDYTSLGNNICSTPLSEVSGRTNETDNSSSFLINRIDIKPQTSDFKAGTVYTPEPYRKWQHLFKFHSWMPFYADIGEIKADPTAVRPGVSIMTQNHLSTLISSIGYEYSPEKNHVFHSRITWKGWYPVFESQLDYGDEPLISKMGESVGNPFEIKPGIKFLNTVSVPLRFSSGKFSEYLRPSLTSDYRDKYIYIKEEGIYDHSQTIISGRLFFSNYHNSAIRDIYPGWAQTIDLNYSFAPFDKKIYGSAISMKTSFYFPGFFPNNGIKIRIEKEKQIPAKSLFGNRVSFPRGYKNILSKEINFLSVDYVLPLAYPDFNISSLLYLKRIRTGLFYDYASGPGNSFYKNTANGLIPLYNHPDKESFRSFGFELMADFHILRIPFMISGGVQTAWKKISESPSFELLFNIDLYGMTIGRRSM